MSSGITVGRSVMLNCSHVMHALSLGNGGASFAVNDLCGTAVTVDDTDVVD